jgi:hypothetical protein
MFQIIFPYGGSRQMESVAEVLPHNWVLRPTKLFNRYDLLSVSDDTCIGHLVYHAWSKNILISADESLPGGENFWHDFVEKYPKLDPFRLCHGVVYQSEAISEVYELDELAGQISAKDALHYAKRHEAYYVTYFLGDWHKNDGVLVQSAALILKRGKLEQKKTPKHFHLGTPEKSK